jgi:hypothetical protein
LFKRLLQRGALHFDWHTLAALGWTTWASLEPRSLRGFMRMLLVTRNARASLAMNAEGPVYWPARTAGTARPGRVALHNPNEREAVPSAPTLAPGRRRPK